MKRNRLLRSYTAVGIIVLFIGTCVIPSIAKPYVTPEKIILHPSGFFGLRSNVELNWGANQTQEPIIPRGPMRSVDLEIAYWLIWGICGRLINFLLRGQFIIIHISIIEKPEWCNVIIAQQNLSVTIPKEENDQVILHDQILVGLDEDAPAFEIFPVTIQATVESARGPLGFLTLLQGIIRTAQVIFSVAYKPLIQPFYPNTNIIVTPPLIQVELPIGIKNLGNGRTIVANEVVNYPEGWIVSLPAQLVLDVGEYNEMNLSIIAPFNFSGEKTITVSYTPHSSDDYSLVGITTYGTFIGYYHPL